MRRLFLFRISVRKLSFIALPFFLLPAFPVARGQSAEAYHISGTVVNDLNGAPLANCTVHLSPSTEGRPRFTRQQDLSQQQDILTDEQGHFSFEHLSKGMYRLVAEKRGFPARAFEEHDSYSTAIVTGPDLNTDGFVFRLVPSSMIFGFVIDEANEPVRNSQVQLYRKRASDSEAQGWQHANTAMTDDRGRFEFAGLNPGEYYLSVTARPWYAEHSNQMGNVISDTSANPDLDVTYATTFYPGATDPAAAEPIALKGGDQVQADMPLSPIPAVHLRIHTASDTPGQPFHYNMQQKLPDGTTSPIPGAYRFVSPGVLEVDGLAPGKYEIESGGPPGGGRGSGSQREIDLTGSTTIDEKSESSVQETEIDGKVLLPSGITQQSIGFVEFQDSSDRRSGQARNAQVKQDGTFQASLPAGDYRVFIQNLGSVSIGQLAADGAKISGRTIGIKAGQPAVHLVVQMTNGIASLEGFAKQGDKAASAVAVVLIPEDADSGLELTRRDQSNSDGSFSMPRIIPGRYRLLAVERGWEIDWTNKSMVQPYLAQGISLEIKAGDKIQKNIQVQPR